MNIPLICAHAWVCASLAFAPGAPTASAPAAESPTVETETEPAPEPAPIEVPAASVAAASLEAPPVATGPTPEEQRTRLLKSERSKGQTLAIVGGATFGTLYLVSSAAGAAIIDDADGKTTKERFGAMLMVPLVGPFVAPAFSSGVNKSASASWASVLVGMAQVASFGLMIGGLVQHGRAMRGLYAAPMASRGTGGLVVGGRF